MAWGLFGSSSMMKFTWFFGSRCSSCHGRFPRLARYVLLFLLQRSHLTFQLSHLNARKWRLLMKSQVEAILTDPNANAKRMKWNFLISPKHVVNKLYLLRFRLQSLLSVLAHFVADKPCVCWPRLFQQLLFLTICAFIRSFDDFVPRKLSFIARFTTFFSLSRCITSACWFRSFNLLFLVGSGWICWLLDT